jgi:hypothetical protein
VLLKTARWPWPNNQASNGPVHAITYDDVERRDTVKLNARLNNLRELGPQDGFEIVDLPSYRGNCSGHYLRITDPIQFRMLLEDINKCDLKRMKRMTAESVPFA